MNLARVLLDLWRRRTLVAVVAVGALLVAIFVTYRVSLPGKIESRRYHVGVATTRILVDTPSSQVVAISPPGSDTLGVRANLMASLMVDGDIKNLIAERAGIAPDRLVGLAKSDDEAAAPPDRPSGRTVNLLTTNVLQDTNGRQLPIIQIEAEATDARQAAQLADASVEGLRDYLATKAAAEQVPDARRLRVHGLGPAQASDVGRGPGLAIAFAAGLFVFVAGCATILGVASLIRALRASEPPEGVPLKLVDDPATIEVVPDDSPAPAPAPPTPPRLRWDSGAPPMAAEARRGK